MDAGGDVSFLLSLVAVEIRNRPELSANASDFPSGVQAGVESEHAASVSSRSAPPSGEMRKIAQPSPPCLTKAICRPSGDHAGAVSSAVLVVKSSGVPPSARWTQSSW